MASFVPTAITFDVDADDDDDDTVVAQVMKPAAPTTSKPAPVPWTERIRAAMHNAAAAAPSSSPSKPLTGFPIHTVWVCPQPWPPATRISDYFVQCQKWIFLSLKAGQRFLQAFP